MRIAALSGMVAAVALLCAAPSAGAQPLDAETLWKIKRIGSPTLSPDGRRAAIPVTTYDVEADKGHTDLWVVDTATGAARQLTSHTSSDTDPRWSPDGAHVAFVAKRGEDEANQLYVIPTDGGEARRVTEVPTGVSAVRWFPDGRSLAFVSRIWMDINGWEAQGERVKEKADSKVSAHVWDKPTIRWWDRWIDEREAHVFRVTLDGGEPQGLTTGTGLFLPRNDPGRNNYDIAPSGDQIVFVADSDKSGVDPNQDVFLLEIGESDARNLTSDNTGNDTAPLFGPKGRWLVWARQEISGFYADRRQLVRYDRRDGTQNIITGNWDRSVTGLAWAPDGNRLFGAIDDAANRRVYEIRIRDGRHRAVTGEMSFASLDAAGAGPTLVGLRQSFVEPPTLVSIDPRRGTAKKISFFNDPVLADVDFGTYESVTYKGANGADIQMWINYPPGFDKSKKYPLYLLLHGGPHNGITDSFHFRWNAQLFSGWGYVTAWHNFHGSSGFGQEFTDSINPNRADLPYEDTILAAQWFMDQDWIDSERVGAGGGSYGGYLASILLGREHPFRTLVAHAAVYNVITQYGADYGAAQRRHGEHWEVPEQFAHISPHTGAGNFDTPTLVIHGEKDYRVPLNHGLELFNTLQNRGVPSRLIYYPDENHWILKPQNSIHWYHSKRDWLAKYLGT